ncbi:MAG: bifunctional oligoribonuclease/PAP phosphatase NrnA [Actinobacteria bacterium]|nr:bifunctional oligoribonuclease/PAP phosphatase NrnA [Actinomycetota bacterium]
MTVDAAAQHLRTASRVLLLGHVAPDADSLGSVLALGLALERISPQATVVVSFGDEPFAVPRILRSLPGQHLLRAPADVHGMGGFDVAVSCDVSTKERLGGNLPAFDLAPVQVVIDHHVSNRGFGTINIIDPAAAANVLLALQLIDALGAELTADIAHALYAGLITDTGCFKYSATDVQTHMIAARLMATGINHALIARQMYDDEPFAVVQLLARALGQAACDQAALGGRGLVWTAVAAGDRHSLGLPEDAAERVIDVLRITTEAEVAAVLKQSDSGAWKLSLRSKGGVDVSTAAAALGGGGHRFAAGADVGDDVALAVQAVRRALESAL